MSEPSTILITGGTGNIGSQLVKHCLLKGHDVIATTRQNLSAAEFGDRLNIDATVGALHVTQVDLEKDSSSAVVVEFLEKHGLRPTAIVNNARNLDHLIQRQDNTPPREGWIGEYVLDVVVAYELSMALVAQKGSKLRTIVNISSMYGMVPPNPQLYENFEKEAPIHYGVAKAALIHMTKELAIRLAKRSVAVNAISYGGVEGRAGADFEKRYATLCPMGSMLKKGQVAGAVDFLISDASSGMTGHNLVVDGGWTVW